MTAPTSLLLELEQARRIHAVALGRYCRSDVAEQSAIVEEVAAAALRVHELEDAVAEADRDVENTGWRLCEQCGGSGYFIELDSCEEGYSQHTERCESCDGQGFISDAEGETSDA
jgi:DnaJ-class molecular chaperone